MIRTARFLLIFLGLLMAVLLIAAFTTLPFHIWYRMSLKEAGVHRPPQYIVLLGGSGMPGHANLIRTWYAAKAARYFTQAKVIVALPGDRRDPQSTLNRVKEELVLRGVAPERILFEDSGANTRAEALCTLNRLKEWNRGEVACPDPKSAALLIVTSPEHLLRAVRSYRKAGFTRVDGLPAFEATLESEAAFNALKLGGRRFVPDVGENLSLRYHFWTQLGYELLIIRELTALTYYQAMGWL